MRKVTLLIAPLALMALSTAVEARGTYASGSCYGGYIAARNQDRGGVMQWLGTLEDRILGNQPC